MFVSLKIDAEIIKEIDKAATENRRSRTKMIEYILAEYIKGNK
jgi:hypothetical protein